MWQSPFGVFPTLIRNSPCRLTTRRKPLSPISPFDISFQRTSWGAKLSFSEILLPNRQRKNPSYAKARLASYPQHSPPFQDNRVLRFAPRGIRRLSRAVPFSPLPGRHLPAAGECPRLVVAHYSSVPLAHSTRQRNDSKEDFTGWVIHVLIAENFLQRGTQRHAATRQHAPIPGLP